MNIKRIQFGNTFFETLYGFSKLERDFCKTAGVYYGQPRILTVLSDHEGLSLSELSPICGIGLPSLSVSLRNMQKSGLIQKVGVGKRQRVFLTEDGRTRAMRFHQEMEKFYELAMEQLGNERTERLYADLESFAKIISDYAEQYELANGWKE